MAVTVAKVANADTIYGNRRIRVRTITFDSSYPDNGEPLTPADVGLRAITFVGDTIVRKSDGADAVVVTYDYTNQKLIAYWGNAGTASVLPEVTDTTSLNGYVGRFCFHGY